MDGLTLALDASTYEGSVSILRDGRPVAERTVAMRGEHEERLMPAVAEALGSAGAAPRDLARIVCGAGPGSFTSLRIAAAIAKGIVSATGIPMFAVGSMSLAAVEAGEGRWLVTMDALRGESYAGGYSWQSGVLTELGTPGIVPAEAVGALAASLGAVVVGGRPHARAVLPLLDAIVRAGPVDLARWEPNYGRRAEAQVRWEAAHGEPLGA
jgi:tRNA threonylcarbamoyladenosine biosynthesis protein TsaB